MRRHDTVIFHPALLSYFTITILLIHMLIFEAEGKPVKHRPIGHQKTKKFIKVKETPFRALNNPKLHKRSALRQHRGNPQHSYKDEFRRALDVDIDVKQSRSKGSHHDESDSAGKIVGLLDGLSLRGTDNQTCEECIEEQQEIFKELSEKILGNEEKAKSGVVKPAYKCDEWEAKSRTCWLNRNIGDTVTFILSFSSKMKRIPKVIWKQEFHQRGKEERKHFLLQRENPTWNIVIGSKGHEMRVSPISEIDLDPNLFSAGLAGEDDEESASALTFRIRLIPNDLGFVYPGETLVLNMASYISLPLESMYYVWYMEKDSEFDALPSNMKASPSGSSLTISELRKEQEGIMTCAVYSNLGILVAKKRFIIKEISTNDILMNPTNRSHPFEGKRNSQHSIIKRKKPEEKIEKSLQQLESKNSRLANSKEGFDVDYNMNKEEFSFIDELLEPPSVDAQKPSDLVNRANSISYQKSLKLPPPASAVKMDAVQQERKGRQNSHDSFNVAQHQQYQQPESQYQQQQWPQYPQELQYQQQQSQYQQQQQNQYGQPQPVQQQQYEQHQQQYEQQLQQQYEQQRLQQEQYEQQRLQQEQYEQQRLQQEQYEQQRLQQAQYEQQRFQQEQQQRLQQEQYEQQRLQQEQQRLQQKQQQRLQQGQQQKLPQEQQQKLPQEQQQKYQQEKQQKFQKGQQQQLQQEQQQRSKQEQKLRLQQEKKRLQQDQQRLHQEEKQQPQSHRQKEPSYPGEGREPWMETSSEESEHSAKQNLSPSLEKYSMGKIYNPKINNSFKSESFLSRQRHSTELISPIEQMARPSEQHSPDNYKANPGQIQNFSENIPDNLGGLNIPHRGEDYPSQNFPAGVKGYSERKNIPSIQKEFPPRNFPLDNRQYSEKKAMPYNQKEYSAKKIPTNHREPFKQNHMHPSENEFWSPEMFIENKETRPEDEISKILSRCQNDRECAGSAACIKGQDAGFCRCLPNYHGNGISCWEDMIPRNSRQFSNVQLHDRTNMGLIRSF